MVQQSQQNCSAAVHETLVILRRDVSREWHPVQGVVVVGSKVASAKDLKVLKCLKLPQAGLFPHHLQTILMSHDHLGCQMMLGWGHTGPLDWHDKSLADGWWNHWAAGDQRLLQAAMRLTSVATLQLPLAQWDLPQCQRAPSISENTNTFELCKNGWFMCTWASIHIFTHVYKSGLQQSVSMSQHS